MSACRRSPLFALAGLLSIALSFAIAGAGVHHSPAGREMAARCVMRELRAHGHSARARSPGSVCAVHSTRHDALFVCLMRAVVQPVGAVSMSTLLCWTTTESSTRRRRGLWKACPPSSYRVSVSLPLRAASWEGSETAHCHRLSYVCAACTESVTWVPYGLCGRGGEGMCHAMRALRGAIACRVRERMQEAPEPLGNLCPSAAAILSAVPGVRKVHVNQVLGPDWDMADFGAG